MGVTGSYSYVDPAGALITVNYEAGAMGFTATTDKQDGFLTPRRNNNNRVNSNRVTSSVSSSLDQDALIAQVLAALQPTINSAVQSAISSSSSRSRSSLVETPRISGASVESTFGSGVSVNIDTPEYNIAY